MVYEMLSGNRPFAGPAIDDYRNQHLHTDAPALSVGSSAFKALVAESLFKSAGARPSPASLLARLNRSQRQLGGGLAKLAQVHVADVAKKSKLDRLESQARSLAEQRDALFEDALTLMDGVYGEFDRAISEAAPSTYREGDGKRRGVAFSLGKAQIELVPVAKTLASPWEDGPDPAFTVIAHAGIVLSIPETGAKSGYGGRSHSLWYCDAFEADRYEWIELAFMFSPLLQRSSKMRPFIAHPGREAAQALGMGLDMWQLAWPLQPVQTEEFIDRWATWFGEGSTGRLSAPGYLPEREVTRNWRKK
jgi:serine/threonine-protein kinase